MRGEAIRQMMVSKDDSRTDQLSDERVELAERGADGDEPIDAEYRIDVTDSDHLQLDWSPGGRADVFFEAAFHSTQWRYLRREIDERLAQGVRDWTLHLDKIGFCDSITLGCFIATQSAVRRGGGRIRFLVSRDSHVYCLMENTKLHLVLDLELLRSAP